MPPEKVLVRRSKEDDEEIHVYIPSMDSPKGYIKRWKPEDCSYEDVSLDAYKTTRESDSEQTNRTVASYVKATGKRDPKIALRLPRDYQQKGDHNDYTLKPNGSLYVIEDVNGLFIQAFTNIDDAMRVMKSLQKGKLA